MDPKCKKAYTGVHESATSMIEQLNNVAEVQKKHAETMTWLKTFEVKGRRHQAAPSTCFSQREKKKKKKQKIIPLQTVGRV